MGWRKAGRYSCAGCRVNGGPVIGRYFPRVGQCVIAACISRESTAEQTLCRAVERDSGARRCRAVCPQVNLRRDIKHGHAQVFGRRAIVVVFDGNLQEVRAIIDISMAATE